MTLGPSLDPMLGVDLNAWNLHESRTKFGATYIFCSANMKYSIDFFDGGESGFTVTTPFNCRVPLQAGMSDKRGIL